MTAEQLKFSFYFILITLNLNFSSHSGSGIILDRRTLESERWVARKAQAPWAPWPCPGAGLYLTGPWRPTCNRGSLMEAQTERTPDQRPAQPRLLWV